MINTNENSELRQIVFYNFIYDISQFLTKKEKMVFREISKTFQKEIFSDFQINLILKKRLDFEDSNEILKSKNLKELTLYYKNIEKFTIENIQLCDKTLEFLNNILENNKLKIKIIILNNIDYQSCELIGKFFEILNILTNLNEIHIGGVGNKDKLIIHIEKNNKCFSFSKLIKSLHIDNIFPAQIPSIMKMFESVDQLSIENCSLDEELNIVYDTIKEFYKEDTLNRLNLSYNGIASNDAMESIKNILKHQCDIKEFSLKGLWVKKINLLEPIFSVMKNLQKLELESSKYIFTDNSNLILNNIKNLKILNLGNSRLPNEELENILINLDSNNCLEELKLHNNLLTNKAMEILFKYNEKLQYLKILNLSFNLKINEKGLNIFLSKLDEFKSLNSLDLRNCYIILKNSSKNLIDFILNKNKNINNQFNCLYLFFCSVNPVEYNNLINSIKNKLEENNINKLDNLRIYIKFFNKSRETDNPIIDLLYKKYNLLIR